MSRAAKPAMKSPAAIAPPRDVARGPDEGTPSREFVQSLARGFDVIKAFSSGRRPLTISEVAIKTGLTRAAARRYLLTLEMLGCVRQNGAGFTLTPRILDLGFSYLSTVDVVDVALKQMEEVAKSLHETCSLAVLDGTEIVYIGRVPANRIMTINLVVGSRLPAHATSMGKVLLAYLSDEALATYFASATLRRCTDRTLCSEPALRAALKEVRARGWALSDQETELGVRTIAVPVFDRSMKVVAAMNVSGHTSRVSTAELKKRYLPELAAAARETSRALGAIL
jgi:IclR family transcriptional regulator, pca regulon regulatory protein